MLGGENYGEMQSFLKERFETDSDKGINIKEELENLGGRKDLIIFYLVREEVEKQQQYKLYFYFVNIFVQEQEFHLMTQLCGKQHYQDLQLVYLEE